MNNEPTRPANEAAAPPAPRAAPESPVAWVAASPAAPPVAAPTPPPVSLWHSRDLAIASALLGFPGGFGLVARNAWRLGRRGMAWTLLLVGAAIVLGIFFVLPADVPRGAVIGINLAVVAGLVLIARQQVRVVERRGRAVDRASATGGLATFVGGWVVTAAPAFLLAFALTFLGSQPSPPAPGLQAGAGSRCRPAPRWLN